MAHARVVVGSLFRAVGGGHKGCKCYENLICMNCLAQASVGEEGNRRTWEGWGKHTAGKFVIAFIKLEMD